MVNEKSQEMLRFIAGNARGTGGFVLRRVVFI
jgi:hypothetical protein